MKPKSKPKTAVVVFTLDPEKLDNDRNAEMSAWIVNDYEDDDGSSTLEVEPCDAYADLETKLQELFGKGMVGISMFDEDDLGFMAKRFRKPQSFLKRLLSAGRP